MQIKFTNRKGEIQEATIIKEYTYKKTNKTYWYVKLENNKKRLIDKSKVLQNELN